MSTYTILCIWLIIISIFRIVTYKRKGQFNRRVGLAAWILVNCLGALLIFLLSGDVCVDDHIYIAPVLMIFTLAIYRSQGNVATAFNLRRMLNG